MDYLTLKKKLIAVFDHFLSCHDINELEEMMQAFEHGKSLIIKLPEAIHRDDYKQDMMFIETQKPKKTVSRIRRKKYLSKKAQEHHIKICDIPVLLDLAGLTEEKRHILQETLKGEHKIEFHQLIVNDIHGFAKAKIFKTTENISAPLNKVIYSPYKKTDYDHIERISPKNIKSEDNRKEELIRKIKLEIKNIKTHHKILSYDFLKYLYFHGSKNGAEGGNRTPDLPLTRRLHYRCATSAQIM